MDFGRGPDSRFATHFCKALCLLTASKALGTLSARSLPCRSFGRALILTKRAEFMTICIIQIANVGSPGHTWHAETEAYLFLGRLVPR